MPHSENSIVNCIKFSWRLKYALICILAALVLYLQKLSSREYLSLTEKSTFRYPFRSSLGLLKRSNEVVNDTLASSRRHTPHRQTRVVLFTSFRGGSSFFGGMFLTNPDVFYMFEPLKICDVRARNTPLNRHVQVRGLHYALSCDFDSFYEYIRALAPQAEKIRQQWFDRIFSQARSAAQRQNMTLTEADLSGRCREKSHVVAKIIRGAGIDSLIPLMEDGVKVVQSIRDPRGTIASRRTTVGHNWSTEKILEQAADECQKLEENLLFIKHARADRHLAALFAENYRLVRYDDVMNDLRFYTKSVYNFLQMELPQDVADFAATNPKISLWAVPDMDKVLAKRKLHRSPDAAADTHRLANTPPKWKKVLSDQEIRGIERLCDNAFKLIGFKRSTWNVINNASVTYKVDIPTDVPYVITKQ